VPDHQAAAVSVDDLLRVESNLTRSFVGSVLAVLTTLAWTFYLADMMRGVFPPSAVGLLLLTAELGFYVWYAVAAGKAARALGEPGWKYVTWILAAPILSLIPIPVVSTIIGVSPLSIKFLLGGQLQAAIRQASFADLHSA
jgi:hypothetical protein